MAAGRRNKVIRILSSNERSLFNAINSEDHTAAKQLIEGENVDVNVQDSLQRTPLIRACMMSDKEEQMAIVQLLLKRGADVNLAEKHRRTALMVSCKEGPDAVPIINVLLRNKADPNLQDENGDTALLHAIQVDNLEAVQALLESQARVNVELKNIDDDYALFLAAKQQNPAICEVLVRSGRAVYSDIPQFLRKHLPPECRGAEYEVYSRDPFEIREAAQNISANPYEHHKDPAMEEEMKRLEEEAKALALAEERSKEEARRQAEARAKAEEEERARAEAEMLREEEARKAKEQAEAQALAEAEAQALAEAKAKAEAEAEAQAKAQAEAQAKAQAEAQAKAQAEAQALAEAEAQALAEADARAKAEEEARARARAKAEAQAKAEADRKAEAEAKAKAKTNWTAVKKKNLTDTRPTTARHNRPVKSKSDLKTFKTKSGRTIFPNAPHDRSYDKISAVREGIQPAPKKKDKPKKGALLADIADKALKKRTVYSTP